MGQAEKLFFVHGVTNEQQRQHGNGSRIKTNTELTALVRSNDWLNPVVRKGNMKNSIGFFALTSPLPCCGCKQVVSETGSTEWKCNCCAELAPKAIASQANEAHGLTKLSKCGI
jgi:hypothetical protein